MKLVLRLLTNSSLPLLLLTQFRPKLNSAKSLVIDGPKYVHQAAITCQVMCKKRRLRIDFREMRSEPLKHQL